jgi:hypothetical protein
MAQEPKRNLFQELKTRSVFRVAAMYLVIGWVLLQFIDVVAEPLALPDWFGRILIVGSAWRWR